MRKQVVLKSATAAILLMAAAAPVWAALEGDIDYSRPPDPKVDFDAVTGSIDPADTSEPDCGPVYMPTIVRERDGSIVGVAYVLDGDDC